MANRLPGALPGGILALALIAPAAAQDIGGHVVEDPYADFPRIVLDEPAPEPRPQPQAAAPLPAPRPASRPEPQASRPPPPVPAPVPAPQASPVTPAEALGLMIGQTLLRELDRALSGRPEWRERYRGQPPRNRGWRGRRDD